MVDPSQASRSEQRWRRVEQGLWVGLGVVGMAICTAARTSIAKWLRKRQRAKRREMRRVFSQDVMETLCKIVQVTHKYTKNGLHAHDGPGMDGTHDQHDTDKLPGFALEVCGYLCILDGGEAKVIDWRDITKEMKPSEVAALLGKTPDEDGGTEVNDEDDDDDDDDQHGSDETNDEQRIKNEKYQSIVDDTFLRWRSEIISTTGYVKTLYMIIPKPLYQSHVQCDGRLVVDATHAACTAMQLATCNAPERALAWYADSVMSITCRHASYTNEMLDIATWAARRGEPVFVENGCDSGAPVLTLVGPLSKEADAAFRLAFQ